MKDAAKIQDVNIFWILMDVNIWQWINQQPHLSIEVYDHVKNVANFKADMHDVYVWACKDPEQMWTTLPFIAINEAIFTMLDT